MSIYKPVPGKGKGVQDEIRLLEDIATSAALPMYALCLNIIEICAFDSLLFHL